MSNKKAMTFALASIAALSLSAVTLVSPKEGKTMCLLNDGNKAFLSMDAAARRKIFTDKDWRREAATKWRSVPKPVTLKWTDAKNEKVHVTVTKKGADSPWFDEDVTGESVEVWNLEIAREYEWTVCDGGEVARGTFKTHDFAPRVMKIKGVPNFRDLGGWKTLDGGRVRQGLVYRSQGLNNNALYYLTSAETMALYKAGKLEELYGKDGKEIKERIDREGGKDDFDPNAPWMRKSLPRADPQPPKARLDGPTKAYLLDKLGIKSDIDLRGPNEVWGMTESPLGPRATWFWLQNHAYGGMHQPNGKEGFTKVFKVFLDEKNYPIDFHCIGGADRTGCDAWILNGLLGVAEDDLMKDWELTCFEYGSQAFGHHRIAHFLKGLEEYPGSTMKEKCESYVKALGFTDDDIAKFRSIMLESAADQLAESAPEVPVFDDARKEFLEMTPAERRAKFTDAKWRERVGKSYSKIKWRRAREGESSRWRRMDGVRNVRDLGGLKGLGGKTVAKGMVFRSAQFNTAAPYRLVTNAQKKAVRE